MKLSRPVKSFFYFLAVVLVLAVAGLTRWHAVTTLGVDFDEDDYLRAAQEYKALVESGDWAGFMDANYRPEHPPLAKIVFGLSILPAEEVPLVSPEEQNWTLPQEQFLDARISSAVLGTLTAGLLAVLNPLAGLFLAVHAMTIKYTSQIMLEALPAFTSLVTVLAYLRWKKSAKSSNGWLLLSAIFLGMTAASKYLYCVVGIAIAIDWVILSIERGKESWGWKFPWELIVWGALSIAFFILTDPYLWPDIPGRLQASVLFHSVYSTTAPEIASASYPLWQPILWFFFDIRTWNENHFNAFYFNIDWLIALAAVLGLVPLWKRERLYVLWVVIGLVFLLVWPTKWPQYILTLTVPVSLAAGELFSWLGKRVFGSSRKQNAR